MLVVMVGRNFKKVVVILNLFNGKKSILTATNPLRFRFLIGRFLKVKAVGAVFNQEKALLETLSVIIKLRTSRRFISSSTQDRAGGGGADRPPRAEELEAE